MDAAWNVSIEGNIGLNSSKNGIQGSPQWLTSSTTYNSSNSFVGHEDNDFTSVYTLKSVD